MLEIEIKGKQYPFKLTIGTYRLFARMTQRYNKPVDLDLKTISFEDIDKLVYCGLKTQGAEIKPDEVTK